jgi:hypothetical protein
MNANLVAYHLGKLMGPTEMPRPIHSSDMSWPFPMILLHPGLKVAPCGAGKCASHCAHVALHRAPRGDQHGLEHADTATDGIRADLVTEHGLTKSDRSGSNPPRAADNARAKSQGKGCKPSRCAHDIATIRQDDVIALLCAFASHRFPNDNAGLIYLNSAAAVRNQHWPPNVLQELAALADHMFFDKEGNVKNAGSTVSAMNVCADFRKDVLQGSLETTELDEDRVVECFKLWSLDFFKRHLTPEQRHSPKYVLAYDTFGHLRLSSVQRSFLAAMMRKSVGSKFAAYAIWQLGLPKLFLSTEKSLRPSMFDDAAVWFGRLGSSVAKRRDTDEYETARRSAGNAYKSSGLTADDRDRQRLRENLQSQIRLGASLRKRINNGEAQWASLKEHEKRTLEDYDCERLQKTSESTKVQRLGTFRA